MPASASMHRSRDASGVEWLRLLTLALLLTPFLLALPAALPVVWADEANAEGEEEDTYEGDAEKASQLFDEAEVAREEERWNDAATLYWKAVEADHRHYEASVRYQEASIKAGDEVSDLLDDYKSLAEEWPKDVALKLHLLRLAPPDQRIEKLEALQREDAKHPDIKLELGRALMAKGEASKAVGPLQKALALATADRTDVLLLLATAEFAADRAKDARPRMENAVKANPGFWEGHLTLARFDLAEEQYESAARRAETVIQQRPSYVAAFLVRSEALFRTEREQDALKVAESAYRIVKDHGYAAVTIALADLLARMETDAAYKQASAYYEHVIGQDEENWRALYGLGWVLERLQKYEDAEDKYRAVTQLKPSSAAAVNSVGYCLYKQGRISEAQRQFKRAADLEGDFITALANLGATYDGQAKYGQAIKIYEKILKQKGQQNNLRALINCAFDYEALGSFNKAAKFLERAHKLLPNDANIMVWLGDNMYFQKKFKKSEKWYQQAIAKDAKNFFAWRGLALALIERERWEDAVAALEKALALKPEELELYAVIGDIYYEKLKDLEGALKFFREYVQRGGDDPDVRDAVQEIEEELAKKKKR